MNKNTKGFMLVEVVITSTVILTALITLYTSFEKLYKKYNEKNNYHNIDSIYATKEVVKYFITNDNFNFNTYLNEVFNNNNYDYIIKDTTVGDIIKDNYCENNTVCSSLNVVKETYNIKNMVITEYDKSDLNNFKQNENINETFKDYIDYVISYYNIEESNITTNDSFNRNRR